MYIYYVHPAMLKCPKQLPNLSRKGRNKHPDCFQGCSLSCQGTYSCCFFMFVVHESGASKGFFVSLTKITLNFILTPLLAL